MLKPAQAERIFLVEDNMEVGRMYERVFRLHGYEVEIAYDGQAALEGLSKKDVLPDAIVMDIMMPRMDGIELLEKLRGDPRLSTVPIAVLTNSFNKEDEQHFLALGAKLYMVKIEHQTKQVVEKVAKLIREDHTEHPTST